MTALRPILLLLTALSIPTAFAADAALMSKGQKIYESNCAACHGKKGEGRGAMFPPIFQSDDIHKKPQALVQSMTKVINGPVTVNGKSYNGFMPATAINDADVAAVATYIMNAFNNGGGTITEADVKKSHGKK
nr:cytochrome c [uncultured Neisseria sp.]